MERYEEISQQILDDGVALKERSLEFCKAMTLDTPAGYVIFIDKRLFPTYAELTFALMHERSHYKTGTVNNDVRTKYTPKSKYEYQANKQAVLEYLPCEDLIRVMKQGYHEIWDIADELNQPPQLVEWAIKIYKRLGKI